MSIEDLTQVKVFTASRHLEKSEDAPSAVTIITADEIAKHGWRTLGEVLNSVRGFYLAYDRDYQNIGVRGFQRFGADLDSRILLMIDGHRLNEKVYETAQVGTEFPLDLDMIERIEIVRGPSSSMFGTNALFGVINIITRRPSVQRMLEFSGDAASFEGRTGRMALGLQKNDRSLFLSGSLYRNNGAADLYFPEMVPVGNGGIAHNVDGDRYDHFFANAQAGGFRLQGLYSTRTKLLSAAPYDTLFNHPQNRSKDERAYADLSYQHSLSATLDVDAHVYYDSALTIGTGMLEVPELGTEVEAKTRGRADWLGTSFNLSKQIGRHRVMFGSEYEHAIRVDLENYYLGAPSLFSLRAHRTPQQAAGYVQAEIKPLARLAINAGGRLDWFDTFGAAFTPRLAAIYTLNARTALKYIYGRAFRAPNAFESYYVDYVVVGEPNPNLRPEHMESHEVVLERRLSTWLHLTAGGYYNRMRGLIEQAPDASNGLTHFVNIGRDTGRGLEFELEAKRASGLSGRASYTLADARDDMQNVRLTSSPLHTAKFDASIPLTRFVFVSPEWNYTSAQATYQQTRVSPSFLTNLSVLLRPPHGNWEISATGYNLLDRRWWSPVGYDLRQAQILQDGRTFRIKLSYLLANGEKRGN